jgi:hypothetical protein
MLCLMASRVAASDTLLGSGVGRAAIVGFCGFRLPAGLNDAVRFADTETPVDDQDYQEVPFEFTGQLDKLTIS